MIKENNSSNYLLLVQFNEDDSSKTFIHSNLANEISEGMMTNK